jgi:hypothetical protein
MRRPRVDGALLGAGITGLAGALLALAALRLPLMSGVGGSPDIWSLRTNGSTPGDMWKSLLLGAAVAAVAGLLCCLAAAGRASSAGRRVGAWGLVVAAFPLAWTAVMAATEISEIDVHPSVRLGWGAALYAAILAAALAAGAGGLALVRDHRSRR